jgi:hypothetical protein
MANTDTTAALARLDHGEHQALLALVSGTGGSSSFVEQRVRRARPPFRMWLRRSKSYAGGELEVEKGVPPAPRIDPNRNRPPAHWLRNEADDVWKSYVGVDGIIIGGGMCW